MEILRGMGGLFSGSYDVKPNETIALFGTKNGIGIKNITDADLTIEIGANFLTESGRQLFKIAKISETPLTYLRQIGKAIVEGKTALLKSKPLSNEIEVTLLSETDGSISVIEKLHPAEDAN
jgi:hypothetical protein